MSEKSGIPLSHFFVKPYFEPFINTYGMDDPSGAPAGGRDGGAGRPVNNFFVKERGEELIEVTTRIITDDFPYDDSIGGRDSGGAIDPKKGLRKTLRTGGGATPLDPEKPKCSTTYDTSTASFRNLLVWPPTNCINYAVFSANEAERQRAVEFYRKLKEYCFNKLYIPVTDNAEKRISAALEAGWELSELTLGLSCCQFCDSSDNKYCPNNKKDYLQKIIMDAKQRYMELHPGRYQNWEDVPGFYSYFIDEPYKEGREPSYCKDNKPCSQNDIKQFIEVANMLDGYYNHGIKTPIVLGDYYILPTVHTPGIITDLADFVRDMLGEINAFEDFDGDEDVQADGFAYTSYNRASRSEIFGISPSGPELMMDRVTSLSSPFAKETSILWTNMSLSMKYFSYGTILSSFNSDFQLANDLGFHTVGLYALDWNGHIPKYDVNGRQIGYTGACLEGSSYRNEHPEDDYNACSCRLFFSFVEHFLKAAKDNGWIANNGWFESIWP